MNHKLSEERSTHSVTPILEKGTCRSCGCTWHNACIDPVLGPCWWTDETETLCSHCDDTEHEPYEDDE